MKTQTINLNASVLPCYTGEFQREGYSTFVELADMKRGKVVRRYAPPEFQFIGDFIKFVNDDYDQEGKRELAYIKYYHVLKPDNEEF